ncbi:radical SAM family heme chaperone HemW [Dasania marina]|uniref:radical SAM family heme chaperone HemW n=1 Tax=Dasania marina TaxID=471499 RepID=UPI0030D7BDBF
MLLLPPLSLYIHIPWCVRKCPYCDFNSHTSEQALPEAEYVDALLADLDFQLAAVQGRELFSIFIGGGTPSLFSAQAINRILEGVAQRIPFANDIEITLEANPGTFEQEKFQGYRAAGVNRLSIGVQSFNDLHLKNLGRIHGGAEALVAASKAQAAGFDNFNIDLMHGLSEQSPEQALADLQQAIDLGAVHISWYQLTIEPNTAFYKSPPIIPNDDQLADIQQAGEALLAQHGFQHYEVSAFSRNNKTSKHNSNYWQFGDYLGIGAGAHGKITDLKQQQIKRQWQTRSPADYLNKQRDYSAGSRLLSYEELPLEFIMNALRLHQGFTIELFQQHTGLDYTCLENTITALQHRQLLQRDNDRISTTELGRRFLNDVLAAF